MLKFPGHYVLINGMLPTHNVWGKTEYIRIS